MDNRVPTSVCIIGAGISGLVTAKTLRADGFNVTVYEKDRYLGGTWSPTRTYPGLRTNNSKRTYEFSDFYYNDDVNTFPFANDVRNYLESYADHFDLRSLIQFRQEVIKIAPLSGSEKKLSVTTRSINEDRPHTANYDKVVICNGVFHKPNIPEVEGMQRFRGRILHSSEVREDTYKTDDQIVIVGGGKSAYDCAAWASRMGYKPTLLFRRPHWMAPRYLPVGQIPGDRLLISRFMTLFLWYYHNNRISRFMHSIGKPLVSLWWRFFTFAWPKDLQMAEMFRPAETLPRGLEKVGVGNDFFREYNRGRANAVRGEIRRFNDKELELDNGKTLPTDTVVFATGWRQSVSFLDEEIHNDITRGGYLRLYRHIVPPSFPDLCFNGYASSFACILTAEIGAHWISELFLGSLKLPKQQEMEKVIDLFHSWADEHLPDRGTEGFLGPYIIHYMDDLLRDLGLPVRREKKFWKSYFKLYHSSRIKGLAREREQLRMNG